MNNCPHHLNIYNSKFFMMLDIIKDLAKEVILIFVTNSNLFGLLLQSSTVPDYRGQRYFQFFMAFVQHLQLLMETFFVFATNLDIGTSVVYTV